MTVVEKARSSAICIDNGMKIRHDSWLKQDRYVGCVVKGQGRK